MIPYPWLGGFLIVAGVITFGQVVFWNAMRKLSRRMLEVTKRMPTPDAARRDAMLVRLDRMLDAPWARFVALAQSALMVAVGVWLLGLTP